MSHLDMSFLVGDSLGSHDPGCHRVEGRDAPICSDRSSGWPGSGTWDWSFDVIMTMRLLPLERLRDRFFHSACHAGDVDDSAAGNLAGDELLPRRRVAREAVKVPPRVCALARLGFVDVAEGLGPVVAVEDRQVQPAVPYVEVG